jgi:hypothetical protein
MMGFESSPKAIGFRIGPRNEFATGKKSIWNPFADIFSRAFWLCLMKKDQVEPITKEDKTLE